MNLPPLPTAEIPQVYPTPATTPQAGNTPGPEFSVQFAQAIATSQAQPVGTQAVELGNPTEVLPAPQPTFQEALPTLQAPPQDPSAGWTSVVQGPGGFQNALPDVFPSLTPQVPTAMGGKMPSNTGASLETATAAPKGTDVRSVSAVATDAQAVFCEEPVEEMQGGHGTVDSTGSSADEPKSSAEEPKKKESLPDPTPSQPVQMPVDVPFVWQAPAAPLVENMVSAKFSVSGESAATNEMAPTPVVPTAQGIPTAQAVPQEGIPEAMGGDLVAQSRDFAAPPQKKAAIAPFQDAEPNPVPSKDGFAIPTEIAASKENTLSEKEVQTLLASAPPVAPAKKETATPVTEAPMSAPTQQMELPGKLKVDVEKPSAVLAKDNDFVGTPGANSSSHMLKAHEQNDFAARTEQYLPEASPVVRESAETAHAKAAHSVAAVQADAAFPFQTRFEPVTASPAPSSSDSTEPARGTVERLFNSISNEVALMRQLAPDKLSVVLRPDADTQIALQLRVRDGAVEGTAHCQRGDFQLLSAHWTELQRSFDQKGIHLDTLRDSNLGFNYSGGSFGGSAHQEQRGRRLEQAIISESSIVSKITTKPRPVSLETAIGQTLLQTWA